MNESRGRHPSLSGVFELDESHAEEAIELLVLAFEADPAYRYFCDGQRPGYRRRLRFLFRSGRAMALASGQPVLGILSGERLAGLAITQEPEGGVPVAAQLLWLLKVALLAGPLVPWRILRELKITERERPSAPHFYLSILAVHPDFQGSGCGRALLEALHARSQQHPQSTGVCLETENPKNVSFYEHLGYRVTARNTLADLEITTLSRTREIE
jgi:ribosomal protein S18 acetylase RimI-like enzyme